MSDFDDNKRLAALRKSISEMSEDELHEIIGTSRNNRQASPKPKKKSTKKTTRKKRNEADLLSVENIENMDDDAKAALLRKLQGDA